MDLSFNVDSVCNKAAGRNDMLSRFGKFVSSVKVSYLNCMENKSNSKEDDIYPMLADFEKSNEI